MSFRKFFLMPLAVLIYHSAFAAPPEESYLGTVQCDRASPKCLLLTHLRSESEERLELVTLSGEPARYLHKYDRAYLKVIGRRERDSARLHVYGYRLALPKSLEVPATPGSPR